MDRHSSPVNSETIDRGMILARSAFEVVVLVWWDDINWRKERKGKLSTYNCPEINSLDSWLRTTLRGLPPLLAHKIIKEGYLSRSSLHNDLLGELPSIISSRFLTYSRTISAKFQLIRWMSLTEVNGATKYALSNTRRSKQYFSPILIFDPVSTTYTLKYVYTRNTPYTNRSRTHKAPGYMLLGDVLDKRLVRFHFFLSRSSVSN